MKQDLTTGTWQDDTGCPISIILVSTSDVPERLCTQQRGEVRRFIPLSWIISTVTRLQGLIRLVVQISYFATLMLSLMMLVLLHASTITAPPFIKSPSEKQYGTCSSAPNSPTSETHHDIYPPCPDTAKSGRMKQPSPPLSRSG